MIYYLPRTTFLWVIAAMVVVSLLLTAAYSATSMPSVLGLPISMQSAQQRTAEGRINYRHFLENIDNPEYRNRIECSVDNWGPGEMMLSPSENFTMLQFKDSKQPILLIFPSRSGTTGMASSPSRFSDLMVHYRLQMLAAYW